MDFVTQNCVVWSVTQVTGSSSGRTDRELQMHRLNLRNNRLTFNASGGESTHRFRGIYIEIDPLVNDQNPERSKHVTGWDFGRRILTGCDKYI